MAQAKLTIDLDALRAMRSLPPCAYAMGDPDRMAYAVYTSGTSGKPRAVAHAHRAIWARQMMFDGWYGIGADDRLLHAGAFNWTFTLGTGLMDPWTVGATALIPEPGADRQDHVSLHQRPAHSGRHAHARLADVVVVGVVEQVVAPEGDHHR